MISKDACKVLIINSVLYCLANGHPQLYTILLQHLSLFIQICNLAKNAKFLPKKQLHLNMGNLASQGLANCGRVAKSVGEASCALLAIHIGTTGTVTYCLHTTRAWSQVVTSTCILHLKSKLPQVLKGLLSIQLAVIVLQHTSCLDRHLSNTLINSNPRSDLTQNAACDWLYVS